MGLGDKIRGQFIDVIEFVDNAKQKQLVTKFEREGDEIKQGARLIVRNGQAAVFVHKGQIADIFAPGDYKLDTENLPVLSTLAALPYRFNSPLKSDLYFVNTTQFINNKWGTKNPIIKRDQDLGIVRIGAFGSYAFRVEDVQVFMNELFGARRLNMTHEIIQYLKSFVGEAIAQCLGETDTSVLDLVTHYRELSASITPYVNEKATALGIEISEAVIENINLPKEVERLIDEQSGIGLASRNMDQFVQYQSARAIRDAARQPGGLSGMGASMTVGKKVAESMDASLKTEQQTPEKAPDTTAADKLVQYKELMDKGILTQEEFDQLKAKLINDL